LGISSKNQWDNKPKKEDFITYGKSCDDDDDESHPNHRVDSVELNSSAMQVGSFFFFFIVGYLDQFERTTIIPHSSLSILQAQ
jgi:hypothetical protein